uniref:Reverse transcriptase domain-containing protein n=1 Tax=Tanacetum cinerariifolium TaxID=118510 RepID=A0A6L2LCZ1_TANCI|nr:hypothetical protein [Tanacetum cinerariifolium]
MADQRTMAELLRAPIEGYAEAIVVPPILAEHFKLKHSLINMMTLDQFFGLEKDNPHDHIHLISKFINEFFPPSRTTNLRNEISNFQQRFDESFHEAWDHYKDLLRACPHHGFTELHQHDTFYNALNPADQDILNSIVGGNLLERPAVNYNQGNSGYRPPSVANQILPSGFAQPNVQKNQNRALVLDGPSVPMPHPFINPEEDERTEETLMDPKLVEYTIKVPPPLIQKAKPPSQRNYVKMLKALLSNKEKLLELENTPLNENFSAVILKKLPEKLGDPGKFLILCGFSKLKCKALADLGASINLMPLSVWKKLGLPELIFTRMTLELANRAICTPAEIARDVFVPVGKFTFPTDFVIIDYESDSRSRHEIAEPLRIEFPSQEDQFQEDPLEVSMADNRTMAQLLQAPTEGYEDAIVIPEISATNFELKHGAARIWLEKEPPRSILTWDDLVSKFINQSFPPSKMTNLRNKITRFQQRFDESFFEAWDRFNDLLRACLHHGFSELHKLDTFYNTLNVNDHDSLNSAAGGNFLDKMPSDCLKIIESKSKVCQTRAKAFVTKVNSSSSTLAISSDVDELKDMVRALLLDKKNQYSSPAPSLTPTPVKAVEPNCVTCGGTHSYKNCPATSENVYQDNIQEYVSQATAANYGQENTGFRPQMVANQIRPPGFPPVQNNQTNFNWGNNFNQNRGSGTLPGNTITNPKEDLKGITTRRAPIQPPVIQPEPQTPVSEPVVAPVSALMPNLKPSIPYPSRRDNERRRDQANKQIEKFYEIFKDMSFEISFTDALILMPKFASTLKALIGNKEKLTEMARTPMNEHCSTVILNKLPIKLGDPVKFLIPCEFPGMDECLALANLDRSVSKPIGIAKDVSVKFGVFHFPADFVVVDFEPDPRVPLILGRFFLKTGRALIDVHKGELTLRIGNEAITYNLDQTSRYSANYDQMKTNKIDVTDEACEEYSQEVLGFSDVTASGSPTPSDDLIVSTTSPTLTLFGDSDFLLFEEADAFLGLEDDPNSLELDPSYYDPKGDILLLEAILNSEPSPPLPNHEQYVPSFEKELKACEAKTIKELGEEEKSALIKDYKPAVQHQRRVNPKIYDVIKKEVEKLLDAGLIYPISDSIWVSPIHCVPKKGGYSVVENEENKLIPTHLVTEWREKTTFTCPYGTFAYHRMPFGLCNASGTFQRFMLAIFHDMVEKTMEVFIDDFSVFGNSFENCLSRLDKMLQRCEDTKLCLNWEKSYFMVKEGIVLGHKISKNGIEVDKAKIDVITKLPHPITVKGAENLAADHLSRLENPYENVLDPKEINEAFPLETLSMVTFRGDYGTPWFADFANYHAGNFIVKAYWALKQANFNLAVASDHRKVQLNELNELRDHVYENSLIYKEKMKRIHDSKIKNRVFNVGDQVLLFNSRLKFFSGKLQTRWSGPFTITKVFPYGTVELSQANEPNFKVNGHRIKHYFGGDVPQLFNPLSGNTTSSSPDHLLEEFADELSLITFPSGNYDLSFDIESDLREIEYLLNHDPTKEIDYILEDSVDEDNLADPNNDLVDTIPEMFTDEHTLDYSSLPLYDDVDDDLVKLEPDNDDEDKIEESKLLIDELDPPRSSDFLPSPECDSVLYEDFFEVDALPSTNNKDKDFNPPLYKLPFHKEVPWSETLLSFSSENEEKVFKPRILTSKGVHSSLLPELSHRGPKAFKVIKIFERAMGIFPCSYGEDIRILDVPCLHFYPP